MTERRPLNTSPVPTGLQLKDYLLLDENGIFADYAKTELIGGEIYPMNAQHRPHARVKSRLYRVLADALDGLPGGLEAIVEATIAIPPDSAPEPDIVITSAAEGDGLIPIASVALVIEVADTSLSFDAGAKVALYAAAAIPEYWIVDVNGRHIQQMWLPLDGAYTRSRDVAFGAMIEAAMIAGLAIATEDL